MAAKAGKHDLLHKIWDGAKNTQTEEMHNETLSETGSNECLACGVRVV